MKFWFSSHVSHNAELVPVAFGLHFSLYLCVESLEAWGIPMGISLGVQMLIREYQVSEK